ncbi:SusC/RagA family TonB-linked outer membrane protein [Roseivirga sp.]|uniref:SusC/RagA family TonB-linked outer membrane protein n=1 Tax=Roseivirga sp. TaxID=1964215 RepID=UPI003B8D0F61
MKRILLTCVMLMLAGLTTVAFAQNRTVTGKVTSSEDGLPLVQVTIQLKGTFEGTPTNVDGEYRLEVPASGGTLVFSYLGFVDQEIKLVPNQSVYNVIMVPDATSLGEVVVTGVAAATPVKKLPFTVSSVGEKVIKQVPATDAGSALAGKIAGVRVQPSNVPGAGPQIQIRGASSLAGNNSPLIVLDGVLIEGSLSDINLQDIERYEVLKGASAATLFGSRAANGVIQLFSKRGDKIAPGSTQFLLRTEYGGESVYKSRNIEKANYHPFLIDPATGDFELDNTGTAQDDPDLISDNAFPRYRDHINDLFTGSTFFTQYMRLSTRGATGNLAVSAEYQDRTGGVDFYDGNQRYNITVQSDQYIGEKLKLSSSLRFIQDEQDNVLPSIRTLTIADPSADFFAPNEEDGSPFNYNANRFSPTSEFNPFYILTNNRNERTRKRFIGSVNVKYDIIEGLTAEGRFGMDTWQDYSRNFQDIGYLANQGVPGTGSLGRGYSDFTAITSSFRLTYVTKIQDWNLRSNAFFQYEDRGGESFSANGTNLGLAAFDRFNNVTLSPTDGLPFLGANAAEENQVVANNFSLSVGGDYQDKYLFDIVVRRDGNSLFGRDNRWQTFARFSAGWRITEDFEIDGIQEAKITGSWGQAGGLPGFFDRFERAPVVNGVIQNPTVLENPLLGPNVTDELELGLNVDFLDKFSFIGSYSEQKNRDQILTIPLSAVTGRTSQQQNAGTLETNTIELTLGYDAIQKNDMNLSFNLIFDRTRSEITEFNRPRFQVGARNIWDLGNRPTEMFGRKIARSLDELTILPDGTVANVTGGLTPSDFKINRDGIVIVAADEFTTNEAAVYITDEAGVQTDDLLIGDAQANFNMALTTSFDYKNFSVFMLWEYQNGGDTYYQGGQWLARDRLHPIFNQGDFPEGQRKANTYLATIYNTNRTTDFWVEDATHLRLRELAVNYDLGGDQLAKIGMDKVFKNVRLSVVGRNLFLSSDYPGYDPASGGITTRTDDFAYPLVRSFNGSIALTF